LAEKNLLDFLDAADAASAKKRKHFVFANDDLPRIKAITGWHRWLCYVRTFNVPGRLWHAII
jgi:hypothetical protein